MKITSSQVAFNTERKYEEKNISKREVENLEETENGVLSVPVRSDSIRSTILSNGDNINIKTKLFPAYTDVPAPSSDDEIPADPKLAAMKRMLEAMMGKKLKLNDISGFNAGTASKSDSGSSSSTTVLEQSLLKTGSRNTNRLNLQTGSNAMTQLQDRFKNINQVTAEIPVRRVRITEFNSHYESENTKFKALGSVNTENGESIKFELHLDMKREFYSEKSSQLIENATLIDPIVVNFTGKAAELTDVKFKFDLNSDGKDEELSWLSSGSGFLVLDKNQDGVVNSGSELFGPATNNGFEELSQLDEDKNGWIDENDAAFEKLSVWSGDTPETAGLKSLKESGIGAIAVSSADTEFSVKDQKTQKSLGQIRKTGIYLEETGKVGTIQQLDFSI